MGNRDAVLFAQHLFKVSALWDDLIDRDKKPTDAEVHDAFQSALVELPLNPFYRRHLDVLLPFVIVTIHNWRAATDFERSGNEDLQRIAFVLRSSYADILVMSAHLLGGWEHAHAWTSRIRELVHDEGFDGFKASLEAETLAREGPLCGEIRRFDRQREVA